MKWVQPIPELGITGSMNVEDLEFKMSAIPEDLTGKSVLDLASFDGYYSYVAYKRGARPVVGIDNGDGEEILNGPCNSFANMDAFPDEEEHQKGVIRLYEKYNMLNKKLDVDINFLPIDVTDMDKIKMRFDIIFCFGLYYHVKDIYGLFEKCYNMCNEMTIIEGHCLNNEEPFFYMVDKFELHNDCTNFWCPTPQGLVKLLLRVGFKAIRIIGTRGARILLQAYKEIPENELLSTENK